MCYSTLFKSGTTYIIGELIAKDNLNIENLMQTKPFKIFFSKTVQQNNILRYCTSNSPWVCVIKVCSSGYNNHVKLYNNTIALGCLAGEL